MGTQAVFVESEGQGGWTVVNGDFEVDAMEFVNDESIDCVRVDFDCVVGYYFI